MTKDIPTSGYAETVEAVHERWTVNTTAYLRNLDQEDLRGKVFAIHYQDPPRRGDQPGTTTYSLRFPALIVAGYLEKPQEVAEKIAAVLNEHWDSEPAAEQSTAPLHARIEALEGALRPFALVADEYERWQAKGSTTEEHSVRFGYGKAQFNLTEFRHARALLNQEKRDGK